MTNPPPAIRRRSFPVWAVGAVLLVVAGTIGAMFAAFLLSDYL